MTDVAWKNRIVGTDDVDPTQLLAHDQNYRRHSKTQQDAMEAVFEDIGWVQNIVVSKRTGKVVDGHMRVELAMRRDVPTVPVVYVDLNEDEERKALATIDPLGSLAFSDTIAHKNLVDQLGSDDPRLAALSMFAEDAANDPYAEWDDLDGTEFGMPEYEVRGGRKPFCKIVVNFQREEDFMDFAKAIGQDIKPGKSSTWYPYREREDHTGREIVFEEVDES